MHGREEKEGENCLSGKIIVRSGLGQHMYPGSFSSSVRATSEEHRDNFQLSASANTSASKEPKEVVDKLLNRTRSEMDAIVQPGGPSPKGNSVLMSTSQLKPALDNMQNSANSTPSQAKGKKRERGDQSSDSVKRERSSKADDSDSGSVKIENLLRSEAARLTEKGALVCFESVEKIVEFIQPNRTDKKLDLVSRSMIAGVIAATDRFDCLTHFVQLKGLSVLDEWLQDVHKGRVGEVGGSKEGEKPVEEFLIVLLRALDKLPVNLHALQTCNIGRSVNRLRSHRNLEIQRKARSLVDIWKKRVEAEMNVIDAKPVPNQVAAWQAKSNLPEVHGGRNSVGPYDVSLKSSTTPQPESKTAKSIPSPSGSVKSSTVSVSEKESQPRIVPFCGSDIQLSGRDEKNGSSAPSQLSGNPFSVQEETRVSTAGLTNANRTSSGSSRHRKSTNGFLSTLGSQKETLGRNPPISRNAADEKLQPSTSTSEKSFEVPVVETSSHKLIVKIPNRIETDRGSPAQSASGGSFDDPSLMSSRASSPVLSDIRESDHNLKEKPDSYLMNVASDAHAERCHDNDPRDLQVESDDRGKCSAGFDEAQSKNVDGSRKSSEKCKASCSSLGNDLKAKQLREASASALNALIESCVKYSEASTPTTSVGDDLGMNLLASVAAREMCASDVISPADSMHGNSSPDREKFVHDELKSKPFSGDNHVTDRCTTSSKEGIHLSKQVSTESIGDRKSLSTLSGEAKNVTADCSEMDEKENIEQQVKNTTSTLSTDPCPEKEIDVKFNSDTKLEARPDVTPDGEPCVSGKEGTKKEQNVGEADEKCTNSSFGQSEGQKLDCKRRGTSAAEDDRLLVGLKSDANEQKGDAMKANAKNEVVTETRASASFLENESSSVPLHNVDGRGKFKRPKLSVTEGDKMEETTSTMVNGGPSSASAPSDMVAKMDFDLNEGLSVHDAKCGESGYSGCLSNANEVKPLPTPVSLSCTSIPAAITVAAAAKGPFVPPVDLLRNKGELGWKGSATTSAFRPVEPRKFPQLTTGNSNVSTSDDCTSKPCRMPLDIDLNVADERLFEDMGCQDSSADMHLKSENMKNYNNQRNEVNGPSPYSNSGGLDLDLNRVDDTTNILQYSTSNSHKLPSPVIPVKSLLSASLSTSEVKRDFDFDLNSGPGFDDVAAETSSLNQLSVGGTMSMNSLLPASSTRPYSLEARNFSAWLPPGNPYSSVAIPSVLPDRGEPPFSVVAPQRILGASSGGPFTPDMYRGSLMSASPAVPFASGPFPYQMFPFGTTLPLPSGTFSVGSASTSGGRLFNPALNSQFLAPVSEVPSQYPKPYMIGLHEGTSNGGLENTMKWSRQGFDLNAGPGASELDGREDLLAQRQLYVSSSQAVPEEQGRIYPMTEGLLKRKEPEAGLDRETFRYKQSSWQ